MLEHVLSCPEAFEPKFLYLMQWGVDTRQHADHERMRGDTRHSDDMTLEHTDIAPHLLAFA